jgi:two-component system, OmpR family, response regulator VanR
MNSISILKTLNVLVVEDDDFLRSKFSDLLDMFFHNVYSAENGAVALEKFQKESIHVLFTDIEMPRMGGIELIEKVRQLDKNIPIVVISAYTDSHILLKSIELHLIKYLVKPIELNELKEVLHDCLKSILENSTLDIEVDENVTYSYTSKHLINNGEIITLSKKEYQLLELLLENKNKPVSKELIREKIWDNEKMSDAALKNFILRLRKKTGADNILTVATIGYMIP